MPDAAHTPASLFPGREETARLELLQRLDILDTAAEPAFDALVQAASLVCRCPISLMSLIDQDRQWFKAAVGMAATETPRDQAFCAHAIRGDDLFLIPDARHDARFAGNPLVIGDPQIRFYAGQPIVFEGIALGTLCVIDRVPRDLDADQRATLRHLSAAMGELLHGRLEALLHRREAARLHAFARLSGDWLWETDAQHRCSWFSGNAAQVAPLFAGAIPASPFRNDALRDRTGAPVADTSLGALFARDVAFADVIVETSSADGKRFVRISAEPIDDGVGGGRGFRGSARDVTAQVLVEREIREQEGFMRKIAGHVPGVIYQLRTFADGTSRFPCVSDGLRDVFELEPRTVEADAAAFLGRIHPADRPGFQEAAELARQNGTILNAQFRLLLPLKGERWVRATSMPERLADGSTLWYGFMSDITDAHARDRELGEAHEALQSAQRRLLSLTDNVPALIAYIDCDLRYVFVNGYHRRIFGKASSAFVGRTMAEVHGDLYAELEPQARRALRGERVSFEGSKQEATRLEHFQSSFVPDIGADGDVLGFYALTFNLTARREAELKLIHSEKVLLDITNHVPAVIGEFDLDGKCLFANDLALRSHGLTRADMDSLTFRSPLSDEHFEQLAEGYAEVLAGHESVVHGFRLLDGVPKWFKSHFVPSVDEAGVQRGFYVATFDVTTLKQAETERAISEKRLRQLTDNLPVMISTIDADERTTYVNECLRAWIGKKVEDIVGHKISEVIGAEMYEQRRPYLQRCLAGERVSFDVESAVDGDMHHFQTIYLPHIGMDGRTVGATTVRFDVTHLKQAEHRLSHLAHSDALTGLPNRLRFDDEIARVIDTVCDPSVAPAIMFLDIDRFKTVNDTHGHGVGDAVLKEFAARLRRIVRRTDFVARLAGDEFVIVLERVRSDEAARIARKIGAEIGRPFHIEQRELVVTTSIGIGLRDRQTTTGAALLAKADAALYRAKEAGRNTFRMAA